MLSWPLAKEAGVGPGGANQPVAFGVFPSDSLFSVFCILLEAPDLYSGQTPFPLVSILPPRLRRRCFDVFQVDPAFLERS
jgi:hypothetical protein